MLSSAPVIDMDLGAFYLFLDDITSDIASNILYMFIDDMSLYRERSQ